MSHAEHEWAREQVAAHLAGGLGAEERARFEAHVLECAECIAEVDAARRFEKTLDGLFAPVRPKAGLEERVIRSLRRAPKPETLSVWRRTLIGVAAAGLMGLTGFVFLEMESGGSLAPRAPEAASADFDEPALRTEAAPPAMAAVPSPYRSTWAAAGEGRERGRALQEQLKSAPSFEAPEDRRLLGAEELAQLRADDGANRFKEFYADVKSADRSESAVEQEFQLAKGDSLDFLTDKPVKGKAVQDLIGGGAGGDRFGAHPPVPAAKPAPPPSPAPAPEAPALALGVPAQQGEGKDAYYRFQEDAGGKKAAPPGYFKPAELAKGGERESLNKSMLGRQAGAPAPEPKPEPRSEPAKPQDGQAAPPEQPKPAPVQQRKVIRSGEIEFEIEAFDSSVAKITSIAAEEGGFVGTVNSEKLPNGKVRGTVVVRVPPDRLDTLLLKLRALGDLKSQRIGSQDVTKAYYDLESRLRAALAMEERLIRIIKDGTGAIKDLLLAEKELGEWRTRIEQYKGEIHYYNNLVGLSTLTITLFEKEIRSASGVVRTERVDMGVEVEDVEKAHREALLAIADAKGRVTRSELKQHAAGQFNAILQFEVAPAASGQLRDRLKQLGTLSRFDLNVTEETEGGTGAPKTAEGLRVTQKDSVFNVSVYNLANVAPRLTTQLNLACLDAEAAYQAAIARIEKAGGRVVSSNLNRQKNDQTMGTIVFEVKTPDAEAVLADVRSAGEVMRLTSAENPDVANTTRSKRGFTVQIFALGAVAPRETSTLRIAARDVAAAYRALLEAARKSQGRIIVAQLNEGDRRNLNGRLDFDVRREHEADVDVALRAAGETLARTVSRVEDSENVVDSKVRYTLTIQDLANLPARETTRLTLAVKDVAKAHQAILAALSKADAWVHGSQLNETDRQNVTASLTFDVRKEKENEAATALQAAGLIYTRTSARAAEGTGAADSKSRFELSLFDQARIPARETHLVAVEVGHVKGALEAFEAALGALKGRVVDSTHTRERSGRHVSRLVVEVPLGAARSATEKLAELGTIKLLEAKKNPAVPESELALARLDVTVSNEVIVDSSEGPWANIKKGLSVSLTAGSYALMLVMIGVCFVLPLGLLLWGGARLWKRLRPKPAPAP